MSIKLYYHPFSTYSRRVLIAFAEKQIPHELVAVDMAARKHREQSYLSLNPYGRVPTLDEDGLSRQRSSPISRRPVRRRHWRRAGRASGRSWTCT